MIRAAPLGGGYGLDLAALLAAGGYAAHDERMTGAGIDVPVPGRRGLSVRGGF